MRGLLNSGSGDGNTKEIFHMPLIFHTKTVIQEPGGDPNVSLIRSIYSFYR
jgi:hypothetical protein